MTRAVAARLLRLLLVAGWTAAVFAVLVLGLGRVVPDGQRLAAAVRRGGRGGGRHGRSVASGWTRSSAGSPTTGSPRRTRSWRRRRPAVGAGSLEQALPGLAQVLAEGAGAQRAAVWLVGRGPARRDASVSRRTRRRRRPPRTSRCCSPARTPTSWCPCSTAPCCAPRWRSPSRTPRSPPPTGASCRTWPTEPALLLRSVARSAELHERVRRADELAAELRESRQKLTRAREVERRRLVGELSHATTGQLAALRGALHTAAAT